MGGISTGDLESEDGRWALLVAIVRLFDWWFKSVG